MDHSIETATRYSHLNKEDVRDAMFKNVYSVEELTEEERGELKKNYKALKKQVQGMQVQMKKLFGTKDKELVRMLTKKTLPPNSKNKCKEENKK